MGYKNITVDPILGGRLLRPPESATEIFYMF